MKGELGRYTPPDGKHVYVPGQYMCAEHEANNIEVFKVREEVNVTSIFMAELATYNITVVEKYPCYFTPERGNTTQTIRRFFPDGTKLYFHEIYQKDVVWAEHAHKIGMEQAMKDYTEIEGKEISQEEFVKFLEPGRDWLLEFGLMPKAPRSKEHSELTTDQQEKATDPSQ
ncbi:hypothetical protein IWQ62_006666 [Dispira parvispora]|uniref:Uncharacterized protein n=1 Tax=Dispira parvispora TaxID=1520584 RepID=A0A9W8E3F4_9FUNG|nr:hypothetical protein IWQ62_006666 [Dispira parvispora]